MDSEFLGGIGRKLTLAVGVAGALTALATTSHASHYARGGYARGYAYRSGYAVNAGYRYGGGYGGYRRGYRYYGGPRYYGAPRSFFSFGLSFGYPRYYAPPPVYVYGPPPAYVYGPPGYAAPLPPNHPPINDNRDYENEYHGQLDPNDQDWQGSKSNRDDQDWQGNKSDRSNQDYNGKGNDSDHNRDYDQKKGSSRGSEEIDVENEPPAGTYYHDRFCNKDFRTLDDYTEHLKSKHHSQTIDILDQESNKRVRTLELVDGYWQVKQVQQ